MEPKKEINKILKENLQAGKQIQAIILILKDHLQRDLDVMEDYYVKYKCLKYCLDGWIFHCIKQLQALEAEYLSETLEDINRLTPKSLLPGHFPRELRLLTQNKPFKILEDFCSNYISEDAHQERLIIFSTFKSKIFQKILENVSEYRDAREYLEEFQLLLTECGISKQELISELGLQNMGNMGIPLDDDDLKNLKTSLEKMKKKYEDSFSQKNTITRILHLHNSLLSNATESEKLIVKSKLGTRLEYFVKPPTITLEQDTLTICGCALSVKEVYQQLLQYLQDVKVKEVHLYSPDVIVVDQSLEGDELKGVNFVVSTTKLIINSNYVWDFSGRSGKSGLSINPPKAINPIQNGLDGIDGRYCLN